VAVEVPYDQIPEICGKLCAAADHEMKKLDTAKLPAGTATIVGQWYEELVRPFLSWPAKGDSLRDAARAADAFAQIRALPGIGLAPQRALQATLTLWERFCAGRGVLGEQERLQFWLHGWLYLHVPLSAAMLILAAAHAVIALYY